ncbi:MAG: AMP-dependent synthetase [Deltaproteobacteria bacterium CG11_big_fil_rev_8_21_14_0_20_45_16]|nr:MAG: AMP-dependent synthetase [Deltaproteobacteria bacterium CG11_big_fil_rev_8_21_14_0_20_45_16]
MTWEIVDGESLPECFYRKVKADPSAPMFSTKRDGQWHETTASKSLNFILRTMAGLRAEGFGKDQVICIVSENREEWILTDYAAQWLGGATTAIYTNSSVEDVQHILNNSETSILFVSNTEMLSRLGDLGSYPHLRTIVAWEDGHNRELVEQAGKKLISKEEFTQSQLTETEAQDYLKKIQPDQMTILLYTSGTTGEPKGVVLSQNNVVANLRQMLNSLDLEGLNVTMSFLPLSHIYERTLQSTMLLGGVKVCFAESIEKLIENMAEVSPRIMIGVPRIFEKMYLKIQEKLKNAPYSKKLLAKWAFSVGKKMLPYRLEQKSAPPGLSLAYSVADRLVLEKIRAITGGKLKYFVSGGAPLSKEIAEFFFAAGITILEGYGLSETMILGFNRPGRIRFGTVGEPFEDTEYKIAEDGEILVRGPQMMKAYFKMPELSKQSFTEDGWFKTGDIGELDKDNFLKITDRKKELLKTSGGKYIAPQPLENKLKADPLVEQVCIVGDGRKYVTALIVPNLELCRSWASREGINLSSLRDCVECQKVQERFERLIKDLNSNLPSYSTIKYFKLIDSQFSVNGGELTPTLKLKRRVIQQKYKSLIDSMYPEDELLKAIS